MAARPRSIPQLDEFPVATEVFARGFAFTRSIAYPCRAVAHTGGAWLVTDAPRPRDKGYRNQEWIARADRPEEVHALAKRHSRGQRYFVCAMRRPDEDPTAIRDAFRVIGYRLVTTEPFMSHPLSRIPRFSCDVRIRRVTTKDLAERLNQSAGAVQLPPQDLEPGASTSIRQYAALDGQKVIGWVRSITVSGVRVGASPARADCSWVSNLHVEPVHRRRGIGRALMARMLRDDRTHGVLRSVLTASHTGARLYPLLGYTELGVLMLFALRRAR